MAEHITPSASSSATTSSESEQVKHQKMNAIRSSLQKLEEAEEMERETVTGNSEITAWSRCLGSAYLQCLLHVNRKYGRGGIRRGVSGVL